MSSFAEVFQQIFDGIFRTGNNKPRLRKVGLELWVCAGPDGRRGFGVNPEMAYGSWRQAQEDGGLL